MIASLTLPFPALMFSEQLPVFVFVAPYDNGQIELGECLMGERSWPSG